MTCLGAPFNQVDQNTVEMLRQTPEVKSWFYGWNNAPERVATGEPGSRELEPSILRALGLLPSP